MLREAGNVVAVVAGHSHSGGYALDDHGIHHVVVEAIHQSLGITQTVEAEAAVLHHPLIQLL